MVLDGHLVGVSHRSASQDGGCVVLLGMVLADVKGILCMPGSSMSEFESEGVIRWIDVATDCFRQWPGCAFVASSEEADHVICFSRCCNAHRSYFNVVNV